MKFIIAALLLLALVGCKRDPDPTVEYAPGVRVTLRFLFEQDGCKIYRFVDLGDARYLVKCQSGAVAISR